MIKLPIITKENITRYDYDISLFLAKASKISYLSEQEIKDYYQIQNNDEFIFFNNNDTNTQGYCVSDKNTIIIVFRGTNNIEDWINNGKLKQEYYLSHNHDNIKLHCGFNNAIDGIIAQILTFIYSKYNKKVKHILITGHSLGGALSSILSFRLKKSHGISPRLIYTFGQPRVGNIEFAKDYDNLLGNNTYRIINENDFIPKLPNKSINNYSHFNLNRLLLNSEKINESIFENLLSYFSNKSMYLKYINDHKIDNYIINIAKNKYIISNNQNYPS